jgi:hypothetical protein
MPNDAAKTSFFTLKHIRNNVNIRFIDGAQGRDAESPAKNTIST